MGPVLKAEPSTLGIPSGEGLRVRTLTPRPTAHPIGGNDDGGKDYAGAKNDDLSIDTGLLQRWCSALKLGDRLRVAARYRFVPARRRESLARRAGLPVRNEQRYADCQQDDDRRCDRPSSHGDRIGLPSRRNKGVALT
jgi:hypothetical protein